MFRNLVSIHDVSLFVEKARQGRLGDLAARLARRASGVGPASWDHVDYPLKNWWDIPAVMARWNSMISGDPSIDYVACFMGRHLAGRSAMRALSLGSGTGHREIDLARTGRFAGIDAVDISPSRIAYARRRAAETGLSGSIRYIEADARSVDLPRSSYDLVIVEQFLHHMSPVEQVLSRIRDFLAPGGLFILNEFVGPSRFQWTDVQLAAVNGLLARLPERYRVRYRSGTVKRAVHRPGRFAMILYDPTEAVESSRIAPCVRAMFDVVEWRGYGGTVLQLLLSDIASNFLGGDEETARLLAMCFEAEDELLASGALESDFAVAACRSPAAAAGMERFTSGPP